MYFAEYNTSSCLDGSHLSETAAFWGHRTNSRTWGGVRVVLQVRRRRSEGRIGGRLGLSSTIWGNGGSSRSIVLGEGSWRGLLMGGRRVADNGWPSRNSRNSASRGAGQVAAGLSLLKLREEPCGTSTAPKLLLALSRLRVALQIFVLFLTIHRASAAPNFTPAFTHYSLCCTAI